MSLKQNEVHELGGLTGMLYMTSHDAKLVVDDRLFNNLLSTASSSLRYTLFAGVAVGRQNRVTAVRQRLVW